MLLYRKTYLNNVQQENTVAKDEERVKGRDIELTVVISGVNPNCIDGGVLFTPLLSKSSITQ